MRALQYDAFGGPLAVRELPSPVPSAAGVVVRVGASGVCRSDWHGWQGHDPDISLPHVPGHELAGTVEAVGPAVRRFRVGDRVTVPFVCACGRCAQCADGNGQVCSAQTQPGFTHWGSFADQVVLHAADLNLVALPDAVDDVAAASLGCRFATAYRGLTAHGGLAPEQWLAVHGAGGVGLSALMIGEWVAVHGCGGVGLSAVQIAVAFGAQVVAVDISDGAFALAASLGAVIVDGRGIDVPAAVREVTGGGAHLSLDALGSEGTCVDSVLSLRPRGRHIQVGLLPPSQGRPAVPMERVVAGELELLGSHGLAAHDYPALLDLIGSGRLRPELLVTRELTLAQAGEALMTVGRAPGIAVVTSF